MPALMYVELGQPFEVSTTGIPISKSWILEMAPMLKVLKFHIHSTKSDDIVVLTLTAPTGQQSSDTMNVVVHHPVLEQPPKSVIA